MIYNCDKCGMPLEDGRTLCYTCNGNKMQGVVKYE